MKKTWTGWGPGSDQPQQHYLVEPRHLAGGGDLRYVAEYLRASGWKDLSRSGGPMVFDSPDRTVRVGYDPTAMPGGWTVSGQAVGQQPAWHATFTTAVPIEAVAGFTDTLTKPRSAHAPNPWAPLEEHGWETTRVQEHVTAVAPDDNAWLQYHQNSLARRTGGPARAPSTAEAGTPSSPLPRRCTSSRDSRQRSPTRPR